MLFLCSLGALVFSLVPAVLTSGGVPERLLWTSASALLCGFFIAIAAIIRITAQRLPTEYRPPPMTLDVSLGIQLTAALALAVNALWLRNPGLYIVMILVLAGLAVWTALFFIFPPPGAGPREPSG